MVSHALRKALVAGFFTAIALLYAISLIAAPNTVSADLGKPNPFFEGTTFELTMPRTGNVTIVVYDVIGRHVRTLIANEKREAGVHPVDWDGKDESGSKVLPGMYLAVLSVDGVIVETVKAVKVMDMH